MIDEEGCLVTLLCYKRATGKRNTANDGVSAVLLIVSVVVYSGLFLWVPTHQNLDPQKFTPNHNWSLTSYGLFTKPFTTLY